MTMSLFSSSGEFANDAEFRAFITNYRTALTAAGFVRTSDTGQVDPTTVVKPASNAVAGYDIWRFNDTAQATHPIFFKIEYGLGTVLTRIQLWITVGTGSNGSGAITGITMVRQALTVTNSSPLAADTWVAGGDGYLASGIFVSAGSSGGNSLAWMVDRLRLATGAVDVSSSGAGIAHGKIPGAWNAVAYDGAWAELNASWPALNPLPAAANGLYRGTTYAYPYHPIVGTPRPPIRSAICAWTVDIGYLVPFTLDLYGVPHTFRGVVPGGSTFGRGGAVSPAMRYD